MPQEPLNLKALDAFRKEARAVLGSARYWAVNMDCFYRGKWTINIIPPNEMGKLTVAHLWTDLPKIKIHLEMIRDWVDARKEYHHRNETQGGTMEICGRRVRVAKHPITVELKYLK